MAGTSTDFDAAEFRTQITAAMKMGKPNQVSMQTTWRWSRDQSFTAPHDPAGKPYSWTAPAATDSQITDLIVEAAVDRGRGNPEENALATFVAGQIEITLLDVDYDKILAHGNGKFPGEVLVSGDVYEVMDEPDVVGLFSVDVWTVHAQAQTST